VKVVRTGTDKSVNIGAKSISLEYLIDQKLASAQPSASSDTTIDINSTRAKIESVKQQKQAKRTELQALQNNTARSMTLDAEIKQLDKERMELTQRLDSLIDKRKSDSRTLDAMRRKFRDDVLSEADVICTTLSGAGHENLEQQDFDMLVIDEAAQGNSYINFVFFSF